MTELLVDRDGAVLLLTINRPRAHNALNRAVLQALDVQLQTVSGDPSVRAVVVTGTGEKAFSAGADLTEIAALDADGAQDVMRLGQQVFRRVETAPVPVIAAVNGIALGGGFELALATTFPVLSTAASLGLPEAGLGLIPGYGGTQRLPRAVGRRVAAYLMLTGQRLDAGRAQELGLTPVPAVPPEELLPTAVELAQTVARQGPRAVRSILTALDLSQDAPLEVGLTAETQLAALAIASSESTEGVAAFTERRPAEFADREAAR